MYTFIGDLRKLILSEESVPEYFVDNFLLWVGAIRLSLIDQQNEIS